MMTREKAIELARRAAKANPPSYYAEPFQPHEWVIDAILAGAAEVSERRGFVRPTLDDRVAEVARIRAELEAAEAERKLERRLEAAEDYERRAEAAAASPMSPSVEGQPLHDAKRDPSAGVRYGAPGMPLVQSIRELYQIADASDFICCSNERCEFVGYISAAPRFKALCDRSLELVDLLEATNESLHSVLEQREHFKAALLELDAGIPKAIASIDRALMPLEVNP